MHHKPQDPSVPSDPDLELRPADEEALRDELLHAHDQGTRDRHTAITLGISAFGFYSSIYFIKVCVFAARWSGHTWFDMDYKTALAIAQSTGYLVGKLPAALLTPKLGQTQLLWGVLVVVWCAGILVLALGVLPSAFGPPCLFLASACLASAWSLMMRFIEGRALTDAIVAVVSLSWIGVSGVVKTVGVQLVLSGLPERAMVVACACFGLVSGTSFALAMASRPPPSALDERVRGARRAMRSIRREGLLLLSRHGPGIALTTCAYMLCGTLRVYRDFFMPELFAEAGLQGHPASFALSEGCIALLVIVTVGSFARIGDNRLAYNVILVTATCGVLLVLAATLAWRHGVLGGLGWITAVGAGVFLMYMPIGCSFYDRLLGAACEQLTTTLLSVIQDASTTAGAAALLLYKEYGWRPARVAQAGGSSASAFFAAAATAVGALSAVLLLCATVAFDRSVGAARQRVRAKRMASVSSATQPDSDAVVVTSETRAADDAATVQPVRAGSSLTQR